MADAPDLRDLTFLLGQCLGRIDEEAFHLIDGDTDAGAHEAAAFVLEDEAARLQGLVASILAAAQRERVEHADLNRIVEATVGSMLRDLPVPVVIRMRLEPELQPAHCVPGHLTCAVQRAIVLASSHAGAGGEILLTTRGEDDAVVLELSCSRGAVDRHLGERAVTLRDFVGRLQGRCDVDVDPTGVLLLALSLPASYELDQG